MNFKNKINNCNKKYQSKIQDIKSSDELKSRNEGNKKIIILKDKLKRLKKQEQFNESENILNKSIP